MEVNNWKKTGGTREARDIKIDRWTAVYSYHPNGEASDRVVLLAFAGDKCMSLNLPLEEATHLARALDGRVAEAAAKRGS